MKTSGTLQSIRSIAGSKSADESLVRFNRFTGKAIVMGSSGSRFGLVSWVRKLYTTSSDRKIQKFLMDGIAQKYGQQAMYSFRKESLNMQLALRTVKELKGWHKNYKEIVGRGTSIQVADVDPSREDVRLNKKRLSNEVELMMVAFKNNPETFISVANRDCFSELKSLSAEDRKKYCKAGLERINKSLENNILQDLKTSITHVNFIGYFAEKETIEASAREIFYSCLSNQLSCLLKECAKEVRKASLDKIEGKVSLKNEPGVGDNFVKQILDAHCNSGTGKISYEQLLGSRALRQKAETRLRAKYVEHNSDITKTIYTEPLILAGLDVGDIEQRKDVLNTVLCQEMDSVLCDYERGGFLTHITCS